MGKRYPSDCGKLARYTVTVVYSSKAIDPVHLTLEHVTLAEVAEQLDFLDDQFDVLTMCLSLDRQ